MPIKQISRWKSALALGAVFALYAFILSLLPFVNFGLMLASPLLWLNLGSSDYPWWMGFIVKPVLSYLIVGSIAGALLPLKFTGKKALIIQSLIRFVICNFVLFVLGFIFLVVAVDRAGV